MRLWLTDTVELFIYLNVSRFNPGIRISAVKTVESSFFFFSRFFFFFNFIDTNTCFQQVPLRSITHPRSSKKKKYKNKMY